MVCNIWLILEELRLIFFNVSEIIMLVTIVNYEAENRLICEQNTIDIKLWIFIFNTVVKSIYFYKVFF